MTGARAVTPGYGLALAMGFSLLAGGAFGADETPVAEEPVTREATSALERIARSGTIRFGHRKDAPPFSFVDDEGRVTGYSIDLCEAIARDIGEVVAADVAVEWVEVDARTRFSAVETGGIDVLCGATTITIERAYDGAAEFSLITFFTGGGLIYRRDAPKTFRDLDPSRIAVVGETTAHDGILHALDREMFASSSDPVVVKTYDEALGKLRSGDADVVVGDRMILRRSLADADLGEDYMLSERYLSYEPYALAYRYGDRRLARAVNGTLAGLYRSGQIATIVERHFAAEEIPTKLPTLFEILAIPAR